MTQKALRIAFAGTPDFAAQHLQAILQQPQNYNVVAVYSQPDRPAGRGKKLTASPVKALAILNNIPVHQPLNLSSSTELELLQSYALDVLVVVAYGLLLPQAILDTPRFGCLNVHASLLPRWRGAAPIERAILAGDTETGISVMQMDQGLDTGDVLLTLTTPLNISDNCQTLTATLLDSGCQGLLKILQQLCKGETLQPVQQNNTLSLYADKLNKIEALIQWNRPALDIQKQINAFYPRSPAYCFLHNTRIRIIQSQPDETVSNDAPGTIIATNKNGLLVACQDSCLLISQVQLAGKKANSIANLLNGQAELFRPGLMFYSEET